MAILIDGASFLFDRGIQLWYDRFDKNVAMNAAGMRRGRQNRRSVWLEGYVRFVIR